MVCYNVTGVVRSGGVETRGKDNVLDGVLERCDHLAADPPSRDDRAIMNSVQDFMRYTEVRVRAWWVGP
jgi:hypothetical protein